MRIVVALQLLIAVVIFAALTAGSRGAATPAVNRSVDWDAARALVAQKLVAELRERSVSSVPRYERFSRAAPSWNHRDRPLHAYEVVAIGNDLHGEVTIHHRTAGSAKHAFRIDLAAADVLILEAGTELSVATWVAQLDAGWADERRVILR